MSENHIRGASWDPPLGSHFRYFVDFSVLFVYVFLRVVLEGFRERFRVDFGTILEGNFRDVLHTFRCTLHIAKPRFDMIFAMFAALRRFQKSSETCKTLQILRHISERCVRIGFLDHFGLNSRLFSEASGHQNRNKCEPNTMSQKLSKQVMRIFSFHAEIQPVVPWKET